MKKFIFAALIVLLMAVPAIAKTTFTLPTTYTQDDFKNLSRDLGLAISYDPLSPAEPLGGLLPGFDAGVEVTAVKINKSASYWQNAVTSSSSLPDYLYLPKIHVQVGLPVIPLDLGVEYATIPGTDIKLIGGELKYAILKGGIVTPAIAVRGAYTKLSGVDVFDIETKSLDLSISKGFAFLTPYAGVGEVWITSTPNPAIPSALLSKANLMETKGFVGLKFSLLPILNIVAEADFAKVNAYSLRLNLHF